MKHAPSVRRVRSHRGHAVPRRAVTRLRARERVRRNDSREHALDTPGPLRLHDRGWVCGPNTAHLLAFHPDVTRAPAGHDDLLCSRRGATPNDVATSLLPGRRPWLLPGLLMQNSRPSRACCPLRECSAWSALDTLHRSGAAAILACAGRSTTMLRRGGNGDATRPYYRLARDESWRTRSQCGAWDDVAHTVRVLISRPTASRGPRDRGDDLCCIVAARALRGDRLALLLERSVPRVGAGVRRRRIPATRRVASWSSLVEHPPGRAELVPRVRGFDRLEPRQLVVP
jgi:hypothetical protein